MNGEEKESVDERKVEGAQFAEEATAEDLDSKEIPLENLPV